MGGGPQRASARALVSDGFPKKFQSPRMSFRGPHSEPPRVSFRRTGPAPILHPASSTAAGPTKSQMCPEAWRPGRTALIATALRPVRGYSSGLCLAAVAKPKAVKRHSLGEWRPGDPWHQEPMCATHLSSAPGLPTMSPGPPVPRALSSHCASSRPQR